MGASVDYKKKYFALRAKFIESMDISYRLGYEEGMKDSQMQQMQEQKQQAQQEAAMAQQAGMPPGQEGTAPPEEAMANDPSQVPMPDEGGDELGDAMNELDSEVSQPASPPPTE